MPAISRFKATEQLPQDSAREVGLNFLPNLGGREGGLKEAPPILPSLNMAISWWTLYFQIAKKGMGVIRMISGVEIKKLTCAVFVLIRKSTIGSSEEYPEI